MSKRSLTHHWKWFSPRFVTAILSLITGYCLPTSTNAFRTPPRTRDLAMRQALSVVALALSIVMLAAIPARSQGARFLDGSATADVFKGTLAAGGGVGVVLSPRYDLRFEFEAARWEFASSHGRSE